MAAAREIVKSIPGAVWLVHTIRNDTPAITRRIRRALRQRPKVFFVQIGSNDGLHGDPIRPIIYNDIRFSGIFIEPVKAVFDRLKSNYGNEERFTFINAAIAEEDGYKDFFYVSDNAKGSMTKLPQWWDQLGSFDINHILKHLDGEFAPFIIKSRIVCQRLESVLERNAPEKIDLVHIDTEGYDYDVLLMFDFSRYQPKVILYESKHLSTDKRLLAREMLERSGYKVYSYVSDTLAVHPVW